MKRTIRWQYLAIGTFAFLFAGIIYAWSILKVPFSMEFGWSADDLATVFTVTLCCFCLGCIFSGFLMRYIGIHGLLCISAAVSAGGFIIVSKMDGSSLRTLLLGYGLLVGTGIGMSYNTILAVVGAWFPDKKGVSTGILMMGFGASTMLFGNIAAFLINVPAFGWRKLFFAFAVCIGAVLCVAAFILRMPRSGEVPALGATGEPIDSETDYAPWSVLRRKSFWLLFLAMTLLGSIGSSVISFSRDFSLSVGITSQTAGFLAGVLSIANGLGRVLSGFLYDRFHRRFIMVYIGVLAIVSCLICALAAANHSAVLSSIGLIIVGLSYGSNTCALSSIIHAYYGPTHYPQNLSLGLLTILPSSFLAKFSTTLVTETGGYLVPFAVMGAYAFIACALNVKNTRP